MRKQLREVGFTSFTNDQLWHWHGYDYGWRRVYVEDHNRVSPIDPLGERFNEHLADMAERMFAAVTGRDRREPQEWRRKSLEDMAHVSRVTNRVVQSLQAKSKAMREKHTNFDVSTVHEALGLTATEYKPSAEEMAKGRRELGLEPC